MKNEIDRIKDLFSLNIRQINQSKSVLNQSAIVVFTRITSILLNVIGIGLVSRSLNREYFGMYVFLNSFAFIASIFNFGFGSELQNRLITIQYSSEQPDKDQQNIFFAAFYSMCSICLIVGLFLAVFSLFINPIHFINTNNAELIHIAKWLIALFVFIQFISQPFGIASNAMYSFGYVNQNSFVLLILSALFVGSLGVATYLKSGLIILSLLNAIYLIANTVLVLVVLMKMKGWSFPSLNLIKIKTLVSNLFNKSLLFWVLSICALLQTQSSVLMVSISSNVGVAGDFSFFQKIFSVLALLHLSALMPLWPKFCDMKERREFKKIKNYLNKIVFLSFIYYGGAIFVILAKGSFFVNAWSGRNVAFDRLTIITLSLWAIFYGWGNIFSIFLNGIGHVRIQAILAILGTFVYFPVSYYLGKRFGSLGIPLAGVIVMIPGIIILPLNVRSFLKKQIIT